MALEAEEPANCEDGNFSRMSSSSAASDASLRENSFEARHIINRTDGAFAEALACEVLTSVQRGTSSLFTCNLCHGQLHVRSVLCSPALCSPASQVRNDHTTAEAVGSCGARNTADACAGARAHRGADAGDDGAAQLAGGVL